MEIGKEASSSESLLQPSSNLSISSGNGFLAHRPMSASVDSIVHGFKFAAAGRKPPIPAVVETVGQVNGNGKCRERIVNNDALQSRLDGDAGRQDKSGMEAMKVQVPIFSIATTTPSPLNNPLVLQAAPLLETRVPHEKMLPPSQSLRPAERGRKTMPLQSSGKDKRKRTQSSGSFRSDTDCDQSDHGRILHWEDGQCEHLGVSGEQDSGTRGRAVRAKDGRGAEASSQNDEKRPRKRHERPTGVSRSHNESSVPSSGVNKSSEVIVLDDDIKPEPIEIEISKPDPRAGNSNDGHDPKLPEPVYDYENYRRDKNIQMFTDQPLRQHISPPKNINRHTGVMQNPSGVRISSLEMQASAKSGRINGQSSASSRFAVDSNGTSKNGRTPISPGHTIDNSQKLKYKTPLPNLRMPISHEEPGQNSSGEHKLLMALTALTTEKQSLENRLRETISSFNTQVLCTEVSEKRNAELETQVAAYKDTVSGLKKRILGVQKFVDGLGNDYNMLNEKKIHLSKSLNELSWDRNELLKNFKEVKDLTEKASVKIQELGDSSIVLKESQREIGRLQETLKFLHGQLSENAGLLAAERDRTQSLECQIQDDRERNKLILTAIQDGKVEVMEQLAELKEAIGEKDDPELMERLAGAQKIIETRIETDSEVTRNLIRSFSRSIEKLGDRDVDAAELLLCVEKRVSNTSVSMMDLFHETHKMNAEALSYSDGYISYLNSRIINLEAELKELHEKYEVSLVESAEKGHIIMGHQLKLQDVLKRCDDMSTQIERGNMVENSLNESISTLRKNIGILEARTIENPSMVETINTLKQKNRSLEKELSLARDNLQNTILSSQTKDGEIETLRSELETLNLKHKEAKKKIEGFVEEKAGFIALAEEQKMKERIEVETNANMFRQRETSRLHNQIKSLEAQKMKLEADNKEFKTMLVEGANVAVELRKEIQELSKQNADNEASHSGLIEEKTRLENAVSRFTQLGETSNTSYRALERIIATTADELSKALEKITVLQNDKELITGEMNAKEQELERAKSERTKMLTTARDVIALRIVERNLRAALEEAEKEKEASKMEKENAINFLEERTRTLDKALKELRGSSRKSDSISSQYEQDDSSNKQAGSLERYPRGAINDFIGVSKKASPAMETSLYTLDFKTKKQGPPARVVTEIMESPFTNSPSLSPFTSPEPIPETQIEHQICGNSPRVEKPKGLQDLDLRKNQATKFDLQQMTSSRMLSDEGDDIVMSEGSPKEHVKAVDILHLRSACPEKRTLTPFTPGPQMLDVLENAIEQQHSPTTPNNRPKTPLRYRNTRGTTDDTKKPQNRSRKDRGRKNRDDQEWSEDEADPLKNNRGREEPPSMKKSLRGFKDRKKGGKRNL